MAKVSFARTINPSIDDDLDFKFETEFSESKRGLATTEPEPANEKSESPTEAEKERELASDEEVFESTNENGIRYWQY